MDAGSERAFEDFVEDHMMALFGTAYLLVGDVHQAEDLLQSALEKAYRRWRRIATMEYPEAYVRRVIVNLANDRWRRRRRTTEVALDEAEGASPSDDTALIDLRQELMVGLHQLRWECAPCWSCATGRACPTRRWRPSSGAPSAR